ncbi:Disease resistance protein RPM1 [Triticum urartu]|uniref:Disease resistance protein RPM1 n=2 Tax=Triticum urartu TaxID=4572 RepID=M7Z3B8_TRIUA|nr:Disease resistance protein RPM1 [Triticum urartu]
MNSLLDKLGVLENQYPDLAEGVRESLMSLSDVLHSFARQRMRNSLINEWMLQVREVVYDMEDWIDGDPSKAKLDDVEEQIEEFKGQIQGARDRCTRYGLLSSTTPSTSTTCPLQDDAETRESVAMDPKLLHGEAPCRLVGRDEPRNVLVNHLMVQEERRKVVCIVGTGGIGKSTLATGIYRQLQGQFSCGAFVHLGRNPSVKTTLISILKQVMPDWHCEEYLWNGYNSEDMEAWDEKKVINKLWAFLKTKSYFVVLVDMRSIWTWKKISCALPNKDKFADRILITTCTTDVAESCCIHPSDFVHPMERLSEKDSKTLFHSKVPVSEQHRLLEVSDDMLEMCGGGVPLAITITAALLSRKSACLPPDQCHSTPQWMRKVLEISYDDLPLPLKSCFLYLSAFPGNRTIKKDHLIRRWEAEGLIAKRDGESLWETGESYFNELINRRLIQPAFDDDNDEPTGCTVHGVVLDFMESLSAEENFTTEGGKLKCGLFPYERVRRICLDCGQEDEGDALFSSKYYCSLEQKSREEDSTSEESSVCDQDKAISLHLSQVRSLTFCGDVGRIPDLLDHFKLVRVLDLSDVKRLQNKQLGSIGSLSLLRYLALGGADVTELPQQIMELDHLSTLDLRQTEVNELPEFKGTGKLVCLLANGLTIRGQGGGMGEMENLEELSTVCLGGDGSLADNVAGLVSKLMRLRMLGVRFRITYNSTAKEAERQGIKHLVEEVGKSNLQFLFLDEYPHRLLDLLVDCWSHVRPRYLRKFELRLDWLLCPLKVPQDISFLVDLTHLHIGVSIVDAEGVSALGGLPKLVLLKLHSLRPQHVYGLTGEPQSPARLSVSSKDGFQRLKVFWYVCEHGAWTGLQFEEGSMPHLRRLLIDFQSSEDTDHFVLGIQHFSCLVQVRATIYCEPTSTTVSAAETHIRDQVSQNPNNPLLEFNRKRRGRLVRRLGPLSNVKEQPSAVIKIRSLDDWTMMIEQDNKLLVIEFTASWCGASSIIAPFFAHLANRFPDAIFLEVDIDDMKYIAEAYEVDGAPMFLFMNKREVKDTLRGAHKEELLEKIQLQMALLVDK